jgi:hypothetical protein
MWLFMGSNVNLPECQYYFPVVIHKLLFCTILFFAKKCLILRSNCNMLNKGLGVQSSPLWPPYQSQKLEIITIFYKSLPHISHSVIVVTYTIHFSIRTSY